MTRALRDIPAVRALAEREAREAYDAMRGWAEAHPFNPETGRRRTVMFEWEEGDGTREWWIGARLALLTDLSRPASRFALAGLIADAGPWSAATVMVAIELGDARRTQLYSAVGLYDPGGPPNPAADMERLALHVLGGAS